MTTLQSKGSIISRTSFAALDIEEPESEEELEVVEPPPAETEPQKPSKTALKKAARAARLEKKQQERAAAKLRREASASSSQPSHSPLLGTLEHPLELSETDSPSVDDAPLPDTDQSAITNGHVHHPERPTPEPVREPEPESEPAEMPPVLGPSNRDVKEDRSRIQPTPPVQHPEITVAPPPQSVPQPTTTATPALSDNPEKKRQNILTRTLWTFIMIGGFLALLLLGHGYMILLVMVCQTAVYREVTALFSIKTIDGEESPQEKDPWSKTLNWYFFAVTNYYLYGESIIYYFKHVVFADAQLMPFATNHRIISFTLYIIGFVGFVMSLKKGYLRRQFGLFGWVHMSLMLIVVSSHFIVNNILEGLIWFWVPASLVVCNDVFAYVWGITIGRTPLIKLSPKKTVEGFVGAFFSTMLFAVIWGTLFMRWQYMICPVKDLGVNAWSDIKCDPNPVFIWREWEIWAPLRVFLSSLFGRNISILPYTTYHFHLLVMAIFTSLVAPFGGFFASGFKRAFNIKDFGHSIPGHGGMTDRMDCQFLMGVFTYVYYSSLIRENRVTVGSVLQTVVSGLTVEEQIQLIRDLTRYLTSQGIPVELSPSTR